MKLKHVDLIGGCIYQDAREVQTKFRKTFTYLFPVSPKILDIVVEWVTELGEVNLREMMIRCFPQRELNMAHLANLRWMGLIDGTGAMLRPYAPFP